MNEFEAAFMYGDFSSIRELTSKLLYENDEATPVAE
jgi:hypothetical protein